MFEVFLSFKVYLFTITVVQGDSREVHSDGDPGKIKDLTPFGIDAEKCASIVYEVVLCKGHGLSLLDANATELVQFVIGDRNRESTLNIWPTGVQRTIRTRGILSCKSYRWFWASWGKGKISYGTGETVGLNKVFDETDPTSASVKRVGLKGFSTKRYKIRIGVNYKGIFVGVSGMWTTGLIEDKFNTDYLTCARMCFRHPRCGMFNHGVSQGRCALFDGTTSSLTLISNSEWKSWKIMYCNT